MCLQVHAGTAERTISTGGSRGDVNLSNETTDVASDGAKAQVDMHQDQ